MYLFVFVGFDIISNRNIIYGKLGNGSNPRTACVKPCPISSQSSEKLVALQLKCDDTRWRTGGEVKGKLANAVGSQYHFTLPRNMMYPALLPLMRTPRLPAVDWTDVPANLNGLVRFAERRNLVSARVPSHFNRPVQRVTVYNILEHFCIVTRYEIYSFIYIFRLQLKCDGTRWRTGGEVKGKLANAVGSQYTSHYLGTWCIQHYYRWCAHLGCQ